MAPDDDAQEHSTAAHADARLFEFCDTSLDTNLFATQTYQNKYYFITSLIINK
jgi:hypothetical protein